MCMRIFIQWKSDFIILPVICLVLFYSVGEITERYKREQIVEERTLGEPVFRVQSFHIYMDTLMLQLCVDHRRQTMFKMWNDRNKIFERLFMFSEKAHGQQSLCKHEYLRKHASVQWLKLLPQPKRQHSNEGLSQQEKSVFVVLCCQNCCPFVLRSFCITCTCRYVDFNQHNYFVDGSGKSSQKKWKKMYFLLNETEMHLYYYENLKVF